MNSRVSSNYHDILGVAPSASQEEIEQAYRARVREVRDLPGGGDRTHQLTVAYRALRDGPKRRGGEPGGSDASEAGARARVARPSSAFFTAAPALAAGAAQARASGGATEPPPAAAAPAAPPAPSPDRLPDQAPAEPIATAEAARERAEPPAPPPPDPLREDSVAQPVGYTHPGPREEAPAHDWYEPGRSEQLAYSSPAYADDEYDDDQPRRRRKLLPVLAALIGVGLLALLLLLGRNTGGSDPQPGALAQAETGSPGPLTGGAVASDGGDPGAAQEPPGAEVTSDGLPAVQGTVAGGELSAAVPAPQTGGEEGLSLGELAEASAREGGEAQPQVADATEPEPVRAEPEPAPMETAAAPPPRPQPQQPPAPRVSRATPPRYLGGGLVDADNSGGRFSGTVAVRLTVLPNGRTAACRVARSSGNATLDATTCSLLQQRLRFTPATDAEGRPVVSEVGSSYTWGRTPRERR